MVTVSVKAGEDGHNVATTQDKLLRNKIFMDFMAFYKIISLPTTHLVTHILKCLNLWHNCLFLSISFSTQPLNVTGFVKIDPNHTGTEIHFIAEH